MEPIKRVNHIPEWKALRIALQEIGVAPVRICSIKNKFKMNLDDCKGCSPSRLIIRLVEWDLIWEGQEYWEDVYNELKWLELKG